MTFKKSDNLVLLSLLNTALRLNAIELRTFILITHELRAYYKKEGK